MEKEIKTNVPCPPPNQNPQTLETKNIGSETQNPGPPAAPPTQEEEDKKPKILAAAVSSKFQSQGPSQSQSQEESEKKKRKLDESIKELRSSTYFKIRSIISDLRPLFVQVIHASDFHGCKAADDIRKQTRTLIELTKELKNEAPQPGTDFRAGASTEKEQSYRVLQKPSKTAKHNASKLKENKFQETYDTGGSPVGWNFIFSRNQHNPAVYYGVTKEAFRKQNFNTVIHKA